MTATASVAPLPRRDPRLIWGGVAIVVVVLALLALALDVPYLGSFVDWLINRVPPLSYLIVQYAVPIAYGALCGLLCERAGVVNVGIEGMILTSAFVAFLTGAYLHPVVGAPFAAIIAIVVAIVVAMLLSTLHAWLSITIKADQIISGTVINILALGGTAFFNQLLVSTSGLSGTNTLPRLDVPNEIAAIPVVGPIVNGLFNQGPIAMGPWLSRALTIGPSRGIAAIPLGTSKRGRVLVPDSPLVDTSSWLKNAVPPRARMLMTVPLMIWSALIEIDSQACRVDSSIAATMAATIPKIAARGAPTIGCR